ncbi:RNF4 [Sanghuangporus sanghuang]
MGQINSLNCQCSYHSLRTRHSEEGYCTLCQERFSSLRGRDIPNEESEDLKKKAFTSKELNSNENMRGFSDRTQSLPQARFYLPVPDLIYKCEQCPRFFYSMKQLSEHTAFPQAGHAWNARFSEVGGPVPDKIFRDLSICRIMDRLDASLLHLQRPEISKKDLETERQHICCVRCGIYFASREQKRKHFRDVEDYIMRVEAKDNTVWDDAISMNREDPADPKSPPRTLFPLPPSMMDTSSPTRPSSVSRIHATSPLSDPLPAFPAFVSYSSPYIPELRAGFCEIQQLPPLAYRLGASFPHSSLGSSSSGPTAKMIRVSDDFECSLCLENEKDVSSLPCGHVFGTTCIYKTLDSDPRCPLCRRPAERHSVKRLQSA